MKRIVRAAVFLTLLLSLGCSEEPESAAPKISTPEIQCGDAPTSSFVDGQVIRELSVRVEDADRDLVEVKANLNGYDIETLTDDDADLSYNWTPEGGLDPMLCKGQIAVRIEALDSEGNVTILNEIITK